MPQFPQDKVKAEHIFDIAPNGEMYCYRAEIVSLRPYRLANQTVVPLTECVGLVGFRLEERIEVGNWLEDLQNYFDRRERKR